jgi:hypothetical protein
MIAHHRLLDVLGLLAALFQSFDHTLQSMLTGQRQMELLV